MLIEIEFVPTRFATQTGGHERPMKVILAADSANRDRLKELAAGVMSARGEDWVMYHACAHLGAGRPIDLW